MKIALSIALAAALVLCGRDVRLRSAGSLGVEAQTPASRPRSSASHRQFNDAGFNRNQLKGLNAAMKKVGGTAYPESLSLHQRLRAELQRCGPAEGANLVIAAGFLLASDRATYAKKFPNTQLRDHRLLGHAAPFADKKGKSLFKNVEGITYAANESGCLVGVLASEDGEEAGRQHDRCCRRAQDPAGRHLDRRATGTAPTRPCRARRRSSGTRTTSAPRTSARPLPRTRSGRARRCSSRSRAAVASARSRLPTRPASGASASTRRVQRREARPDERDQAHRHGRVPRGRSRRMPASSRAAPTWSST